MSEYTLLDSVWEDIRRCYRCGYCRDMVRDLTGTFRTCPTREQLRFEQYTARGRNTIARGLVEGKLKPSWGIRDLAYTCLADDWESTKRFALHCPYPLMLDESIYGDEEISRAISEKCARAIKLKIVKSADPNELYRQSRTVLENKMDLIIGNGAATDISCCHELLVGVKAGLKAAGEMNGYIKLRVPLLPDAVKFENGCMVVAGGASLVPDTNVLQSQSVDTVTLA